MSTDAPQTDAQPNDGHTGDAQQLEQSTYEIIRGRLQQHSAELQQRLERLNEDRRAVFGSIPTHLLATERITTANNCVPRDIVAVGQQFLFGYNVQLGLRSETNVDDVLSVYTFRDESFHPAGLDLLEDAQFQADFRQLYKYYKHTTFARFHHAGPHLYFVFRVGKSAQDIKAFKWLIEGDRLRYVDSRSEHEVKQPPQHDFQWQRTHRDLHRHGEHPHISIEERVFVETVGGDLTIKVEDNTQEGEGIYCEPVDDPDQTLDDAEIFYAIVGDLILLKMRPYQERDFRYLVFSEKLKQVQRLDTIENACVFLPEGHGLIFSNGYYLQTGENKTFQSDLQNLRFQRRIAAPNGEDYLYTFYNPECGTYVLLSYNVIEQQVATPIVCNGFSLFENGHLVYFKSNGDAQKHHALQIWQTPYVGEQFVPHTDTSSLLYKIGNQDIVRGMAECHEIVGLTQRDDSYENLYLDLARKSGDVLDAYHWLNHTDTHHLDQPLAEIRAAAMTAVDEFEKVVRVRADTLQRFKAAEGHCREIMRSVTARRYEHIHDYVQSLADLRHLRGELIALQSLKYVDLDAVERLEQSVSEQAEHQSQHCVQFLLDEHALQPYRDTIAGQHDQIPALTKVTDAKQLETEIAQTASELEMLIDVVSNLKIDDATHRTEIIDSISAIYSQVNQARAALKKRRQELMSVEGKAEFHAQLKLLNQAIVNYLDVSDTPQRCDEYLTKLMVQVEEQEGRFAEFDEFVLQLSEKRDEIYSAFDGKKVALLEARNRRATTLLSAAERILKGIETRARQLDDVNDIHALFAADLMVEKVRDIVQQLEELEDSVKVDDVQSRLKTIREDAVRQLKDRQELYVGGQNTIQLGKHRFSVNVQPLDLTLVIKDDLPHFHLTGTNFLELVRDEAFQATSGVWNQEYVSENQAVYRGEFLADQLLRKMLDAPASGQHAVGEGEGGTNSLPTVDGFLASAAQDQLSIVQAYMAPRHAEGYLKGVHDHDATLILRSLATLHQQLGMLRFPPRARALAEFAWRAGGCHTNGQATAPSAGPAAETTGRGVLVQRLAEQRRIRDLFPAAEIPAQLRAQVGATVRAAAETLTAFALVSTADESRDATISPATDQATEFLLHHLLTGGPFPVSQRTWDLYGEFRQCLRLADQQTEFAALAQRLQAARPAEQLQVMLDWAAAFVSQHDGADEFREELAVLLWQQQFAGDDDAATIKTGASTGEAWSSEDPSPESVPRPVLEGSTRQTVAGLLGDHPRLSDTYELDYLEFQTRLTQFRQLEVPRYREYIETKNLLLQQKRDSLRLEEFRPRVLTSFVRNQLIDEVYLPLIGDNLAKQMGVAGEQKRTDLMGLLLLISPPGYGKTTLMEYVANRLGLTFMKINGPAIGHQVTSLDPAEAPNASARQEIQKLNLSLEMGDNVMIYLDDIQHCNPEFLQKFISLCDGQRRIEGVYGDQPRTYDLRGRKVAVVMAGNPYTESGEKFQIPDMLANRADTYNLGDVIGQSQAVFELSYLENALTSNPALSSLASHSQADIRNLIQMASVEDSAGIELEGNFSADQLKEILDVLRKLLRVRDVILMVNQAYIQSAAQADAYRTEPPFKLQGSYRDMNKIAERVVPVMNEAELQSLIISHYENQAQTLTTGAEANLLKFKQLIGQATADEQQRWEHIQQTFSRNLLLGGDDTDKLGQVISQLAQFTTGLGEIRDVLQTGLTSAAQERPPADADAMGPQTTAVLEQLARFEPHLQQFHERLGLIGETLGGLPAGGAAQQVQVVYKVPRAFLEVIQTQFSIMENWLQPLQELTANSEGHSTELLQRVHAVLQRYEALIQRMESSIRQ